MRTTLLALASAAASASAMTLREQAAGSTDSLYFQHQLHASNVTFAFAGKGWQDWEHWSWNELTHIGYWSNPPDDARAHARENGVQLMVDCSVGTKDWESNDSRKKLAKSCHDKVKDKDANGVFFDFEGTGLSKQQKENYVETTKVTAELLAQQNATVTVCVGGRPSYENRNYNYADLAKYADFLIVMGYDLHRWDDYTCAVTSKGNVCSLAEASIKSLTAGVEEYLNHANVPADKLVLALPWYGQLYDALDFNMGQIDYKDVRGIYHHKKDDSTSEDHDSKSWKLKCKGDCVDGKKASHIWYDDHKTLKYKFKLAAQYGLRGAGVFEVTQNVKYDDDADTFKDMWDTFAKWSK